MADMMAKLAAAEAEAEKLRSELKDSAASPLTDVSIDELAKQKPAKPASRIDGKGGRETLFGTSKNDGDAWLRDGMDFLVRDQPSESAELAEMSKEDQDTVNRRLAIGLLGTALFAGFSQVSDTSPAPSKPLFFYLVPLVKIRELLKQAAQLAEDGSWDELSTVCRQIAQANGAKENLLSASKYLDAREEEKAKQIAVDFLELLEKIDYNKYFESLGAVSGTKAAEYSKFSKRASVAAAAKLDEFLALMDREQLEAARSQVVVFDPATTEEPSSNEVSSASRSVSVSVGGGGEARVFEGGFSSGYGER